MEFTRSAWHFVWGTIRRFWIWAPALMLDPFELYDQIRPSLPDSAPRELAWGSDVPLAIFITLLVVAFIATFHETRQKWLSGINPRRDKPINWAFNYIVVDSQWALNKKYDGGETLTAAKDELRDAANVGDLKVWGRRNKLKYHNSQDEIGQHPMDEIPNHHWQKADLDYASILHGKLAKSFPTQDDSQHPGFNDLQVNKKQVLELWPKASLLKRVLDFNRRNRAGAD